MSWYSKFPRFHAFSIAFCIAFAFALEKRSAQTKPEGGEENGKSSAARSSSTNTG